MTTVQHGAVTPLLTAADADVAVEIAEHIANRLREPAAVEQAVAAARQRVEEPRLVHWRPAGLWQGYAGLALLSAALDAARPGSGWDLVGRDQLRLAARGFEQQQQPGVGLAAGSSGLATAALAQSRGGTRYRGLTATLDTTLVEGVAAQVTALQAAAPHGLGVSAFDVISGLTGAGRYLLSRIEEPVCRQSLKAVLGCLVQLSEEDACGVPHWFTPADQLTGNFMQSSYPDGHLNLGLAHGISGPLALLALGAMHGVEVAGQRAAIDRTAGWIKRSASEDAWGVNFPAVIACSTGQPPAPVPSRSAWCYGTPGTARALWLAGTANNRPDLQDLAVAGMAAVYRRPIAARRIDSPTLCHGVAGLLQITLRFAADSGLPMFVDAAAEITAQLVAGFEPGSRFGYRNLEPSGGRIDHPGLLDGAAGVALVLLAAATAEEPTWDRVLLVS